MHNSGLQSGVRSCESESGPELDSQTPVRGPELCIIPDSSTELWYYNSGLKNHNPGLGSYNSGLGLPDWGLITQDWRFRTPDWGFITPDWDLITPDWDLPTLDWILRIWSWIGARRARPRTQNSGPGSFARCVVCQSVPCSPEFGTLGPGFPPPSQYL